MVIKTIPSPMLVERPSASDELVEWWDKRCSPPTSLCGCARIPHQSEAKALEDRAGEPGAKGMRFVQVGAPQSR